jgi:hypothetical protein
MSGNPFDAETWIKLAAPALGLAIAWEYRAGVAPNLARLAELAAPLMEFPLGDNDEAAPVFRP